MLRFTHHHTVDMESHVFQPIVDSLRRCINAKLFPGAALALVKKNGCIFQAAVGKLEPTKTSNPTATDTIFDLASLTKPIATATAILLLTDQKKLSLDQSIDTFIPTFKGLALGKATVIQLLTHTSGLPAWKPLYLKGTGMASYLRTIADLPLENTPGSCVNYSCLGYIVLTEIIQQVSGITISDFTHRYIFTPLQMNMTCYNPPEKLKDLVAPTEFGNSHERDLSGNDGKHFDQWRDYRLRGEVHDGNACGLGGVSGNAGLFSNVKDLSLFCQFMLSDTAHTRLFTETDWIKIAVQNHTPGLSDSRGLGWQMAASSSAVKNSLSDHAYGHCGFTGTSIWIDPLLETGVILLTNRAYFGGDGRFFAEYRSVFHQITFSCLKVWESL